MAETLTATAVLNLLATLTSVSGSGQTLGTAQATGVPSGVSSFVNSTFGSGTGADKINQLYSAQTILAASGSQTLVLSNMSNALDPLGFPYSVGTIRGLFMQILGNMGCTYVATVTVNNGGTATYVVGDTMTLSTGTGTAATFRVNAVSAGVITSLTVLTPGSYTVNPTLTACAITGGSGGGSPTVNVTMGTITTLPQSVFTEADYLTIGNAGTNPWNAIIQSTGTKRMKSGTNTNPGTWIEIEGGSFGYVVVAGSSEQLKIVNSGSNPVTYQTIILGATA